MSGNALRVFWFCATLLLALLPFSAKAQQSCLPLVPGPNVAPLHYLSAATDNSTLVKAGPVSACTVVVVNTTATVYYLKLYDKATAPVCGTDTPVQTYPIPFGTSSSGAGFALPLGVGLGFQHGLGFCIVANIADNDDNSAATGIAVNFGIR